MIAPVDLPGFHHLASGKVRDLYAPDGDDTRILLVASDRVSAYDHVLEPAVPDKGAVLTALSLWWFQRLTDLVPHHVRATDAPEVPEAVRGRAVLVERLAMLPVECVARGYLTGSGLVEYRERGTVCGIPLPDGLTDGSRLPEPIFTPATKAEQGAHDENIPYEAVVDLLGAERAAQVRDLTLAVYRRAEGLTQQRGLVLADTKLEFGTRPDGTLVLADEVLTPDSSRFWPAESWSPGGPQPSFDKQIVRDWLTSADSGWDRAADAPPPRLPDAVVERTRQRYLLAYQRLIGSPFEPVTGPGGAGDGVGGGAGAGT